MCPNQSDKLAIKQLVSQVERRETSAAVEEINRLHGEIMGLWERGCLFPVPWCYSGRGLSGQLGVGEC